MYQSPKSATTAGLLGVFLGAFGAHNWYLGEKGKGIAHVCMMSGGVLLEIIVGAILPNVLSYSMLINLAWLITILAPIALAAMSASGIWGLVEGIIILSQGDAGLARKGYPVADPMAAQAYGQPMNNGYGPMNNQMGMNGNMNGMGSNNMNNMSNMNGMNGMNPNNMNNINMNNMNGMNMNNNTNMNGTSNGMSGNMNDGMNNMGNNMDNTNQNQNQHNNAGYNHEQQ